MTLKKITDEFFNDILNKYNDIEGDELNYKIQKLFNEFNDDKNRNDVLIKVAALNKIYSTAINNINPVVDQIQRIAKHDINLNSIESFVILVDKISNIEWTNTNQQSFKRTNLSFASKYVHFLSNREIPIYDSYIWIIIKSYQAQKHQERISFSPPKDYLEFYNIFCRFRNDFELKNHSNYKIDKFLWTYGKLLIDSIAKELRLDLENAKTQLKRRLKNNVLNQL